LETKKKNIGAVVVTKRRLKVKIEKKGENWRF